MLSARAARAAAARRFRMRRSATRDATSHRASTLARCDLKANAYDDARSLLRTSLCRARLIRLRRVLPDRRISSWSVRACATLHLPAECRRRIWPSRRSSTALSRQATLSRKFSIAQRLTVNLDLLLIENFVSHFWWHIAHRGVLAHLQHTQVSRDCPTVRRRNLRLVVRHCAPAVGDHVVVVSYGSSHDSRIANQIRGLGVAALHDHSIAIANPGMARRAVDVVALLPALKNALCNRERKAVTLHHPILSRVVVGIGAQLAACHGSGNLRARSHSIVPKRAAPQWDVLRLVMHI